MATKGQSAPRPGIHEHVRETARAAFRRIKSETLVLTREEGLALAQTHLTLPRSPTEREFDEKHARELLAKFTGGHLLPCNWATVIFDGTKYRMNGQHSSWAAVEAADILPEPFVIHLDQYEAPSAEGMALLFRQFDARVSARDKNDVAGCYQGLVKQLEGVSRRKGKLAIEGIAWYNRSIPKLPVPSGDDLYQEFLCAAYHPFIRWLDKILTCKTPELDKAPIVAAMYQTFINSEAGAQEFWSHVAKSDLSDDSEPASVLSQELVAIREGKAETKPAPAEYYAKCIKAWNAFRGGVKVRSLNVNVKKELPNCAA